MSLIKPYFVENRVSKGDLLGPVHLRLYHIDRTVSRIAALRFQIMDADQMRRALVRIALEIVAEMALKTMTAAAQAAPAPDHLIDKHFNRKHGPDAYYGQKERQSP